jgi:hypothetical protein
MDSPRQSEWRILLAKCGCSPNDLECWSKGVSIVNAVDLTIKSRGRLSSWLVRYLLGGVVIACSIVAVASCSGTQPFRTSGYSTALSEAAKAGDLLYTGSYPIYVLSYPKGKLLTSFFPNAPSNGMCSDAHGNVYTADANGGGLTEYSHGGTQPIGSLTIPNAGGVWSCSVNTTTGDLAAAAFCESSSCNSELAVFRKAQGTPKIYSTKSSPDFRFCGYDDQGNIFIDGFPVYGGPVFAELTKGGSKTVSIKLPVKLKKPGQVQWDGRYIGVQDMLSHVIYRLRVVKFTATVVGTVQLTTSLKEQPAWIQGNRVMVPYRKNSRAAPYVGVWRYPLGGSPLQTIDGFSGGEAPFEGTTVSIASAH